MFDTCHGIHDISVGPLPLSRLALLKTTIINNVEKIPI